MSEVIYINMAWTLILDTGLDLTGVADMSMRMFDPAGDSSILEADIETPLTDGKISYTFENNELAAFGLYTFNAIDPTTGNDREGSRKDIIVIAKTPRAGLPGPCDVYDLLEGYCITNTVVSEEWISSRMYRTVIPWITKRTGLSLGEEKTITEYYSGNGTGIMILNRKPINEITGLEYVSFADDAVANLIQSVELIKAEGILISRRRLLESTDPTTFVKGTNNIKVTYKYGLTNLVDSDGNEALDIGEAIISMTAAKVLSFLGARTGGGSPSIQAYSRSFGNRGKYTDIINILERDAYAILSNYFTHTVGAG